MVDPHIVLHLVRALNWHSRMAGLAELQSKMLVSFEYLLMKINVCVLGGYLVSKWDLRIAGSEI